ncbi:putative beta-glucosidase, partial [Hortaea werneckii]
MLHKRLLGGATLLSALGTANAQNDSAVGSGPNAAGPTWNHDDFTTSPPVYPSPNATGIGWEEAFQQASDFVNQLTLEEKAYLVTGTPGPCVGNIAPIPRLGFQGLCLQDGPLAIRQANYASVFPAGITVAASWDRKLAKQRGIEMGSEFRGKGAEIALGPVAGPLGRSGYGGRNWEGFSPDPYLTGILFADTIEGMQSAGVQACAKHYIGNEQETQRNPSVNDQGTTIEAVSSNIDDRTMHELYLWPFQDGVKAGVASFMCSYNRINGSYGCQNSKTLNGILKDELGFQGYVMSDWMATHSGAPAIEAGLDMDMPGGLQFTEASSEHSFFGGNITAAVNNGSLSIDRVDDMCRR